MKKSLFPILFIFLLLFADAAAAEGVKKQYLAIGYAGLMAIESDGTVKAQFDSGEISAWKDVVQVDASPGHALGLKADGTVYASGNNTDGQCDVQDWKDIVMVAAGASRSYGLNKEGTIVSTARYDTRKSGVWKKWTHIVWIDVMDDTLYAVDQDGNAYGTDMDLSCFHDAARIYRTTDEINVLLKNGTVMCMNITDEHQKIWQWSKDTWTDVRELDSISSSIVVLKADGTVGTIAAVSDFTGWKDIVEIERFFGVKSDGSIICSPFNQKRYTEEELKELQTWKVKVDPASLPAAQTSAP